MFLEDRFTVLPEEAPQGFAVLNDRNQVNGRFLLDEVQPVNKRLLRNRILETWWYLWRLRRGSRRAKDGEVANLGVEFPEMKGFSRTNLLYLRSFCGDVAR